MSFDELLSDPDVPPSVLVDASNFQSADDGDTTHYGGFVAVNERPIVCQGTDRDSYTVFDFIAKTIADLLGVPVGEDHVIESLDALTDELQFHCLAQHKIRVVLVDDEQLVIQEAN